MPDKDIVSLLGTDNWLDNLLITLVDDAVLLEMDDRELAIVRAHVIRELSSSSEVAKVITAKAAAVAKRLRKRSGK